MKHNYIEDSPINRNPPQGVMKQLRGEVNYGCPICGSPYLTYHHFDPPWNENHHHKPDGMIALCSKHHDLANGGKYTKEQLIEYKRNPNLKVPLISQDKFGWLRNELILESGGFYINPKVFLRIRGQDKIWFNRDEKKQLLLNLNIEDKNGNAIILIDDNNLTQVGSIENIDDIFIPPSGRRLSIKATRIGLKQFTIEFKEYDQEALRKLGADLNMKLDERPGAQVTEGFIADMIKDDFKRKINDAISEDERQSLINTFQLIMSPPTRWELLTNNIEWPVTLCKIRLFCEYPFPIKISPETEQYSNWKASHTIGKETNVVWDIQ